MSIPKIIHLIEPAHNVVSVWQNLHPDWQCIEWSIEGCYAYLKRYYPDAESTYLSLKTNMQRIHFSWYYLLHRYGGVVVEGNRVPKKKIEGLFLSLYDLYLIEDWFIASAPDTDFLTNAIESLPSLEAKWYDRYLGEKSLVRSTATILPEIAYKKHSKRVYQNYFHPLSRNGMSIIKMVVIAILLVLCFQLVRIVLTKDKRELWKTRWNIFLPLIKQKVGYQSVSPKASDSSGAENVILPDLDTIKKVSVQSLENSLHLRIPPQIRIPPLDPDTPSSISDMSLVITPFSDKSLVITPVH